jgi:hypothetical protein
MSKPILSPEYRLDLILDIVHHIDLDNGDGSEVSMYLDAIHAKACNGGEHCGQCRSQKNSQIVTPEDESEEQLFNHFWVHATELSGEPKMRCVEHGEVRPMTISEAFIAGAKYWEFEKTKATMWASDERIVFKEADRRFVQEIRSGKTVQSEVKTKNLVWIETPVKIFSKTSHLDLLEVDWLPTLQPNSREDVLNGATPRNHAVRIERISPERLDIWTDKGLHLVNIAQIAENQTEQQDA